MPSPELVWIIDDDQSIRWVLDKALAQADLHTCVFDSAEAALAKLAKAPPSAILTDIRMPGMDGLGLLAQVRQTCPQVPVIIMTAHSDLDSAIQSYQGGAFEYLPKPFDVDEAVALVRRALAHAREARAALDNPKRYRPGGHPDRRVDWRSARHAGSSFAPLAGCRSRQASPCSSMAHRAPAKSWSPRPCTATARAAPRPLLR